MIVDVGRGCRFFLVSTISWAINHFEQSNMLVKAFFMLFYKALPANLQREQSMSCAAQFITLLL